MSDSAELHPSRIVEFAEILLNPQSPDEFKSSRSLRSFVESRLKQYRLKNTEVEEVLSEAFLRALKKHNNDIIRFPQALMRSFCFNVVREMKRGQQRYITLEDKALERMLNPEEDLAFLESVNLQTRKQLERFLEEFSSVDRQIVNFWSQGYSNKEIAKQISDLEEQSMTVECVKKRRQRLIERLRQKLGG